MIDVVKPPAGKDASDYFGDLEGTPGELLENVAPPEVTEQHTPRELDDMAAYLDLLKEYQARTGNTLCRKDAKRRAYCTEALKQGGRL